MLVSGFIGVKRTMLVLLLLILAPLLVNAQSTTNKQKLGFADPSFYIIDSLELNKLSQADKSLLKSKLTKFHKSKSDTSKIDVLEEIIDDLVDESWEKYQYYQHNLIVQALKKRVSKEEALKLKMSQGTAINNIGYILNKQGKLSKSLEYYIESLKIREEIQHNEGIATSLLNIGSIYDRQEDYKKAIEYYSKAHKIYKKIDNSNGVGMCINNIGTVLEHQGKLDESLSYYTNALSIYKEVGNDYGVGIILNNIGTIHEQKANMKKALEYYFESFEIRKKSGEKRGLSIVMNNIGSVYLELGNQAKAKEYLTQALQLSKESGYINQVEKSASNLYDFYKRQNNYKEALKMHELYVKMRDSVNNEKNYKESVELNAKYEYEKQRVADSIVNLEAEKVHLANLALEEEKTQKKALELTTQKRQKWILIVGLGLVSLFGFLMFQRFQLAKKQKEVIDEQKNEVEQQKNQIELQHFELEETHKKISDSIKYAERLQLAILPSKKDLKMNLGNSFVLFQPKDTVSGDFYWTQKIEGNVYIATADCTGHGVPGALVSVVCSNALNRSVKEFHLTRPCEILDKTRELVIETFSRSGNNVKDGMDITLIKKDADKITYAGAYNPLWIVRKTAHLSNSESQDRNNIVQDDLSLLEYKANKQPVGLFENMSPFREVEIPLKEEDTIYLFTDGFADQFGGEFGKKHNRKPFKDYLMDINSLDMTRQKEAIYNRFTHWKGDLEQLDDVCIIGIRV